MTTIADTAETEPRTVLVVLAELKAAIDAPRPEMPSEKNWDAERDAYTRELRNMHHRVEKLKKELGALLVDRALDERQPLLETQVEHSDGTEYDLTLLVVDAALIS